MNEILSVAEENADLEEDTLTDSTGILFLKNNKN